MFLSSVYELCVHILEEFSMWNDIHHSQLRLGSFNRLGLRCDEKIRKQNTFLKTTLVSVFASVYELCVHAPNEFLMWNDIQHSQLRLGSRNWLGPR